MKLLSQKELIEKFIKIHGIKFDYSKIFYINMLTKICIICPIHGEFFQTPGNHLKGKGCKKCANITLSNLKTLSLEQFIEKAILIHGKKYDYSKAIYLGAKIKICIVCPIHGEFWQTPDNHLNGNSCSVCGNITTSIKQRSNTNDFIQKAITVHGNNNDYSGVLYINNHTKIKVTCTKYNHGEFLVTPANHLRGKGCPICKASKGELTIKAILNKFNIKLETQYRIPEIVNNLKYDFYLPEHRLLIEFHGIQHYEYNSFFHKHSEDNFLKQKDRDNIVRDNAVQFKYRYLEFNYRQFEELTKEEFEQLVIKSINPQSN